MHSYVLEHLMTSVPADTTQNSTINPAIQLRLFIVYLPFISLRTMYGYVVLNVSCRLDAKFLD